MIHMKCEDLLSLKIYNKYFKMSFAAVVIDTLRVKIRVQTALVFSQSHTFVNSFPASGDFIVC